MESSESSLRGPWHWKQISSWDFMRDKSQKKLFICVLVPLCGRNETDKLHPAAGFFIWVQPRRMFPSPTHCLISSEETQKGHQKLEIILIRYLGKSRCKKYVIVECCLVKKSSNWISILIGIFFVDSNFLEIQTMHIYSLCNLMENADNWSTLRELQFGT